MASAPEMHLDEGADPPSGRRSVDWLNLLWRRKSLLLLGAVVGGIIGSLVYFQKAPVYQSRSQVMVIKKSPGPVSGQGADPRMSFYEDYLSTHLVLIKSPIIVQRAVEKHRLGELPSFQGKGDPTGAILAGLTTIRDTTSQANNILNLSYSGAAPEDCAVVLNAIIHSYKDFLDEAYKNVSDDTLGQITRATESFQKNLEVKEKAYAEFRKSSPLIYTKGIDGVNTQDDLLTQIHVKRLALIMRRAELQGRIETIEKAEKEGRGRQILLAQLTASSATGTTSAGPAEMERKLDEQLFELEIKEQTLLSDFGPDHPDVVSTRKRIAMTREYFKRESSREKGATGGSFDRVQWYIQSLKQELEDIGANLKSLTELASANEKEAREAAHLKEEDKHYRDDIARAQQVVEPIIKRLEEIKLVREMGGYDARVIAPAGKGAKIAPVLTQYLLLAAVLGLLAGVGLAYLAEVTDRSFRTPEEIRRHLGLPVVGHIPFFPPAPEHLGTAAEDLCLDPSLRVYFQPKSVEAESFRGVRTALYFSTQGEEHKVIQVTSPSPGDGKSTVTANLAISIAQSGKKVLLIDCDFRKPRQHKLFRISPSTGMASVIAGQSTLAKAIHATPVEGLWLLPCGPRPNNPAELLTSPQFKDLVDQVRGQYDFVIIDTPPLLAVSDPSVVSPRVDGVLLVIRVSKDGRPRAVRSREILATLGVKVLGVMVNRITQRESGEQYGYDDYSYGYSYGYEDKGGYYEGNPDSEGEPDATGESLATSSPEDSETDATGKSAPTASGRPRAPKPRREKSPDRGAKSSILRRLWPWGKA